MFLAGVVWLKFMNKDTINKVAKKYFETINLVKRKTDGKYVIGMIGGIGVGKTTIAKMIAKKLGFVVVCTDEIRRLLDRLGYDRKVIENAELVRMIGQTVSGELVKGEYNIILDSDLGDHHYRQVIDSKFGEYGYNVLYINVVAKQELAYSRMCDRTDNDELSPFMKQNLLDHFDDRCEIRKEFVLPDDLFFEINNDSNLDKLQLQVENAIAKFRQSFQ